MTTSLVPLSEIEFLTGRLAKLEQLAAFLEAQSRYGTESKEQFEMVTREIDTIHERLRTLRERL